MASYYTILLAANLIFGNKLGVNEKVRNLHNVINNDYINFGT